MSLKEKKVPKKKSSSKKSGVVVTDAVGSYEKHPFFIKKANAAKAVLSKVGLPKQIAGKAHI